MKTARQIVERYRAAYFAANGRDVEDIWYHGNMVALVTNSENKMPSNKSILTAKKLLAMAETLEKRAAERTA